MSAERCEVEPNEAEAVMFGALEAACIRGNGFELLTAAEVSDLCDAVSVCIAATHEHAGGQRVAYFALDLVRRLLIAQTRSQQLGSVAHATPLGTLH